MFPAVVVPAAAAGVHAKGVHVEIQQGVLFLQFGLVELTQADDLAQDLHLEAIALGLGIDIADVGGEARLFFFQALDARHDLAQLVCCNAPDVRHGSCPT